MTSCYEETLLTGKDYAPGISNPDRKAPVQPGFLSYLLSIKETGMSVDSRLHKKIQLDCGSSGLG